MWNVDAINSGDSIAVDLVIIFLKKKKNFVSTFNEFYLCSFSYGCCFLWVEKSPSKVQNRAS